MITGRSPILGLSLGLVWLLSLIYASAIIAPFGGGLVSTGSNAAARHGDGK